MRKNKSAIFGIPVTILGMRIFIAAFYAAGSWALMSFLVNGLQTGAVVNFFRAFLAGDTDNISVVHRTAHPVLFWTYEGLWLLCTCAVLPLFLASIMQFNPLRRIRRRLFIARRKKAQLRRTETRARTVEAQIRSVEAGQGPEPFWIRFPGPTNALSEAEVWAYFVNVFAPFWLPLTPEARQAYLLRNPPPAGRWQDMMTEAQGMEVLDFPPRLQKRLWKLLISSLTD